MATSTGSSTKSEDRGGKPAKRKAPGNVRFLVGASVGSKRFEAGDTAPGDTLSPTTRRAWLDQGLVEEAK